MKIAENQRKKENGTWQKIREKREKQMAENKRKKRKVDDRK